MADLRADLAALLAKVERMTPGLWRTGTGVGDPYFAADFDIVARHPPIDGNERNEWVVAQANSNFRDQSAINARGIVALRNAAPRLLTDLRAARAERDAIIRDAATISREADARARERDAMRASVLAISQALGVDLPPLLGADESAANGWARLGALCEAESARLRAVVEAVRNMLNSDADGGWGATVTRAVVTLTAALAPAPEAP